MQEQILYINFSLSSYRSFEELEKRETHTLLYKNALTQHFVIHYLLRNTFKLEGKVGDITIKTGPVQRLLFLIYIVKLIRTSKIQFVIIHGLHYFLYAPFIKIFCQIKIILQHHAEKTYERKSAVFMPIADKFINAYFFCGKHVANPFIARKYLSAAKIYEVVEGSSDFTMMRGKKMVSEKNIICIARLIENKNISTFLKALSLLLKERNDFKAKIFYSSAELELKLKAEASSFGLDQVLSFNGKIDHSELEHELNDANIFVSPSFYEGSGYSLIEALACGAYAVVSDIPSFSFILEGLSEKKLFDPNNAYDFAKHLNTALNLVEIDGVTEKVRKHFESNLSENAIALQIRKALQDI